MHTVLGAFVAGILVGQSPILTRRIEEQLRSLIVALFMPVFFGLAGLGAISPFSKTRRCCADGGAGGDREFRQIRRRLHWRPSRQDFERGIPGAGLRHECARLDGGYRRLHRALDRRIERKPLHDDRRHGGHHHHGHAADAALVAQASADERRRTRAHEARRLRGERFCRNLRTPADRGGREPERAWPRASQA